MLRTNILMVFGTRPEAIKMAPVIRHFRRHPDRLKVSVCVTGQHRQMLDQVLDFFGIKPDYDLNLMQEGQTLASLTQSVLTGITEVILTEKPDYVYVQGDTTTSFVAALAAFYQGVRVCHVEAGLRTYDKSAPYPEEVNRQLTSRIADIHFAPTITAKNNLLDEGIPPDSIWVTGNTVIDALFQGVDLLEEYDSEELKQLKSIVDANKKVMLVTGHRRESFGDGFKRICVSLKKLAQREDVQIIYPVHLNPEVQQPVYSILGDEEHIKLVEPLGYPEFIWLMKRSYMILTDSGGIQEEAPSLGKPVLVMRDKTERPEAVQAGTVILVGTDPGKIVQESSGLLTNEERYKAMSRLHNPYGDGTASEKVCAFHIGTSS